MILWYLITYLLSRRRLTSYSHDMVKHAVIWFKIALFYADDILPQQTGTNDNSTPRTSQFNNKSKGMGNRKQNTIGDDC